MSSGFRGDGTCERCCMGWGAAYADAIHSATYKNHVPCLKYLINDGRDVNSFDKHKNTPLHYAAFLGHYQCLILLLKAKAQVNCKDGEGNTPLHKAAFSGHLNCVQELVQHGADVHAKDDDQATPLHKACASENVDVVKWLLQSKADPLGRDGRGDTPIHTAAACGRKQAIRTLLAKGVPIQLTSKDGWTALHKACASGHLEATALLLKKGASINTKGAHGMTPLHLAAYNGHSVVLSYLLDKGASYKSQDKEGRSIPEVEEQFMLQRNLFMDIMCEFQDDDASIRNKVKGFLPIHGAAWYGHSDCVTLLARRIKKDRKKIDVAGWNGLTCLHLASWAGHYNIVQYLISQKAKLTRKDSRGCIPLHRACNGGHLACVQLLCETSADVNKKDNNGSLPIQYAACFGNSKIMQYLLDHGSYGLNRAFDSSKSSILHYAAVNGNQECIKYLIENHAIVNLSNEHDVTPLHLAAWHGHAKCVELLIKAGAAVNATNDQGFTPLHNGCVSGSFEVFSILKENGASLTIKTNKGRTILHSAALGGNVRILDSILKDQSTPCTINDRDDDQTTPLHHAVYKGHRDCIRMLLHLGAEVDSLDNQGRSPLLYGCVRCDPTQLECITLLVTKGADIKLVDKQGSTALHKSTFHGNFPVLKYLISIGADVNAKDAEGATPLHKAAFKGSAECVSCLLEHGAVLEGLDNDGGTALHNAAWQGHDTVCKLLLDKGAYVSSRDAFGNTPLHHAAVNGHVSTVNLLIERSAVINSKNRDGMTPLALSAKKGRTVCCETLIQKGAIVNVANSELWLPLHYSVANQHVETAKLLIQKGAFVSHKNSSGQTAEDMAMTSGNVAMQQLFHKHNNDLDMQSINVPVDHVKIVLTKAGLSRDEKKNPYYNFVELLLSNEYSFAIALCKCIQIPIYDDMEMENANQNDSATPQPIKLRPDQMLCVSLVSIFETCNDTKAFLQKIILQELQAKSLHSLFSKASPFAAVLKYYFRKVGRLYLKNILGPILTKFCAQSGPWELEPKHVNDKDKNQKVLHNLKNATQAFLDAILASLADFPFKIRETISFLTSQLKTVWPESTSPDYILFPYLAEAIQQPVLSGIVDEEPKRKHMRALQTIGGIIHRIGSDTLYGSEEPFLKNLNGFIIKNVAMVKKFMVQLSDTSQNPPDGMSSKIYLTQEEVTDAVHFLHAHCYINRDRVINTLLLEKRLPYSPAEVIPKLLDTLPVPSDAYLSTLVIAAESTLNASFSDDEDPLPSPKESKNFGTIRSLLSRAAKSERSFTIAATSPTNSASTIPSPRSQVTSPRGHPQTPRSQSERVISPPPTGTSTTNMTGIRAIDPSKIPVNSYTTF